MFAYIQRGAKPPYLWVIYKYHSKTHDEDKYRRQKQSNTKFTLLKM